MVRDMRGKERGEGSMCVHERGRDSSGHRKGIRPLEHTDRVNE